MSRKQAVVREVNLSNNRALNAIVGIILFFIASSFPFHLFVAANDSCKK